MRHATQLLNVNHFRQRCMKARPDTLIPRIIQIAFVLFARSGAPGEIRTPDPLVRRQTAGMRLLWLPVAGLLAVGVSFGLPLFLYLRERALEGLPGAVEAAPAAKS